MPDKYYRDCWCCGETLSIAAIPGTSLGGPVPPAFSEDDDGPGTPIRYYCRECTANLWRKDSGEAGVRWMAALEKMTNV